jgi:hypothetical protein
VATKKKLLLPLLKLLLPPLRPLLLPLRLTLLLLRLTLLLLRLTLLLLPLPPPSNFWRTAKSRSQDRLFLFLLFFSAAGALTLLATRL